MLRFKGDSGSPLVCKDSHGQDVLTGIVSHGLPRCHEEDPVFFTDTYRNLADIQGFIEKLTQSDPPRIIASDRSKTTISDRSEMTESCGESIMYSLPTKNVLFILFILLILKI